MAQHTIPTTTDVLLANEPAAATLLETDDEATFTFDSVDYHFTFDAPDLDTFTDVPTIECQIYDGYFKSKTVEADQAATNREQLVTIIRALYLHLINKNKLVTYVCGLGPAEVQTFLDTDVSISEAQFRGEDIERLFWLQILSPTVVSRLGIKRLREAPAWHVEELTDGAVLLIVFRTPAAWQEPDADPTRLDNVTEHLRIS